MLVADFLAQRTLHDKWKYAEETQCTQNIDSCGVAAKKPYSFQSSDSKGRANTRDNSNFVHINPL
jgi:hypothetical protein